MSKVLMIMHHVALCTPCIVLYVCCLILALFALDPVEPEPEELQEPAPVEDANPEQDQGKPWCI
jgi:hypothetical protein